MVEDLHFLKLSSVKGRAPQINRVGCLSVAGAEVNGGPGEVISTRLLANLKMHNLKNDDGCVLHAQVAVVGENANLLPRVLGGSTPRGLMMGQRCFLCSSELGTSPFLPFPQRQVKERNRRRLWWRKPGRSGARTALSMQKSLKGYSRTSRNQSEAGLISSASSAILSCNGSNWMHEFLVDSRIVLS